MRSRSKRAVSSSRVGMRSEIVRRRIQVECAHLAKVEHRGPPSATAGREGPVAEMAVDRPLEDAEEIAGFPGGARCRLTGGAA